MPAQKIAARDVDECIYAVAQGDDHALERLYDLTSGAIYAYALSVTKNREDAEDVLHDTFIRAYEAAHNYIPHGKPMAWLFTIAKNLCYTNFRRNARFVDIPDEDIERIFACDDANSDDRLVITQMLTYLDETERQVVVMHAMSGLKHRDIAKVLEMPLSTVLSKYNRAIKKLQKLFKEG